MNFSFRKKGKKDFSNKKVFINLRPSQIAFDDFCRIAGNGTVRFVKRFCNNRIPTDDTVIGNRNIFHNCCAGTDLTMISDPYISPRFVANFHCFIIIYRVCVGIHQTDSAGEHTVFSNDDRSAAVI